MSFLNRSQIIVVLLSFISTLEPAKADIVVRPKDVETTVGTSAVFNCSSSILETDVQWNIYPIGKGMQVLYAYGKINPGYTDRFKVQDGHNLVISSVTVDDAGSFECHEDYTHGEKHSAELIVLESNPICQSITDLDKVVGENTCGIESSQVTLTCIVQYHGKKPPALQWNKNGEGTTITSGVSSETRGNRLLHNLTIKGNSITNGSSYNCLSKKATSKTATCNSGSITIVGQSKVASTCVCDSCEKYIVAVAVCIIFLIIPIFNAIAASAVWYLSIDSIKLNKSKGDPGRQRKFSRDGFIYVSLMAIPFCIGLAPWYICVYRRRLKKAEDNALAAVDNQPKGLPTEEKEDFENLLPEKDHIISIPKPEAHPTEAHQPEEISVESLIEEIENLQRENKQLMTKVKDFEGFLHPPKIIEYVENPKLVQTIKPDAPTKKSKLITGLAMLENELFVLFKKSSEIQVYDSVTYQLQRKLQTPIIGEPFDLTTSKADKCLFIIGLTKQSQSKGKDKTTAEEHTSKEQKPDIDKKNLPESLIVRFNANGELLEPWPKPSGGHKGHLSTYESNVIVCVLEKNVITEFSKNGDLIRVVKLSPAADFKNPWHAIKLSSWHFVVSHRCDKSEHHRICVVNRDGNIVKECREYERRLISLTRFNEPLLFIADGKSFLVADTGNHNIFLLNSALQNQKTLIELSESQTPSRICFDKTQKYLFVATTKMSSGVVQIYDVKK